MAGWRTLTSVLH